MAEKRKPDFVLLLKKQGNKQTDKVEMFRASKFKDNPHKPYEDGGPYAYRGDRWRIRVNGVWWPKGERRFVTKTQLKELLFKNIK